MIGANEDLEVSVFVCTHNLLQCYHVPTPALQQKLRSSSLGTINLLEELSGNVIDYLSDLRWDQVIELCAIFDISQSPITIEFLCMLKPEYDLKTWGESHGITEGKLLNRSTDWKRQSTIENWTQGVYRRCISLLSENMMTQEHYGWPQYLPKRSGDSPGLCGTSYAILAYDLIDKNSSLNCFSSLDRGRLIETIKSKTDSNGCFMLDTHRPISAVDACWESILDLLVLGLPVDTAEVARGINCLVKGMNLDGGWGLSLSSDDSMVFPTTQVISLFSNVINTFPNIFHSSCEEALDNGLTWLESAQNQDGGWGKRHRATGNPSTAANTARALVAFLDAGVPRSARPLEAAVGRLKRFDADDQIREEDLMEDMLDSFSGVIRKFRYSHFCGPWVAYALLRAGEKPFNAMVTRLLAQILREEKKGYWVDSFMRSDAPDGSIAWIPKKKKEEREYKSKYPSDRIGVWPIYNCIQALTEYMSALSDMKFKDKPCQVYITR